MKTFAELGLRVPHILLPAHAPLAQWAVIACDQYTQDRAYWGAAAEATGGQHSTLSLILPEVYLNDADKHERIAHIHRTMRDYRANGVFAPERTSFIYIERTTTTGRMRAGLMAEIDLECYDWHPGSTALIRATEATIPERLPPRMDIRRGAALEAPHIMLLVNDAERQLIERAGEAAKQSGRQPLYSGTLMMNGGSISGWEVPSPDVIQTALTELAEKNTDRNGNCFLFAVGDGNHSLATAQAVWNDYKTTLSESERATSPIRYALVEIVNLYDDGLRFEPIHRVLFDIDALKAMAYLREKLGGTFNQCPSETALRAAVARSRASFGFVTTTDSTAEYRLLETDIAGLAVAQFQPALDALLHECGGTIDYIHGETEVMRLAARENTLGILLPPITKDSFFETIATHGVLPRKSFSMGTADEKRFYVECRALF